MVSYVYKSTITFFNMTMLRKGDNLNLPFLLSTCESSTVYNKLLTTLKYLTGSCKYINQQYPMHNHK